MTENESLHQYLISPCPSVWDYADNGDVLVWTREDRTAAMSIELASIFEEYSKITSLLPPLTAVLLVVDATRHFGDNPQRNQRIVASIRELGGKRLPAAPVEKLLAAVSKLPDDLRSSPRSKARLLHFLFGDLPEHLHEADLATNKRVLWFLSTSASERVEIPSAGIEDERRRNRAFTCLCSAASRCNDAKRLEIALRTGFDTFPTELGDETPESETTDVQQPSEEQSSQQFNVDQLMQTLKEDPELASTASQAINAASLISLPRQNSEPDNLPAGGVSDISNRGQPERLLATELAADPMLLLARIATGSALYMRREKPPTADRASRPILIEDSIRMWGQARQRAITIALAAAIHEQRGGGLLPTVHTIAGRRVTRENITTRSGIVELLGRLSANRHPGQGLVEFAESQREFTCEPLIVVTVQTDADSAFRRCMDDFPKPYLLGKIDRDGFVTLVRRSQLGDETLHRQYIELRPLQKKAELASERNLPLYRKLPYPKPLRCSTSLDGTFHCAALGPKLWLVDRGGNLHFFTDKGLGSIEVGRLPVPNVIAHQVDDDALHLVVRCPSTKQCILLRYSAAEKTPIDNVRVGKTREIALERSSVIYAFDRGRLLAVGQDRVYFLDPDTGNELGSVGRDPAQVGGTSHCLQDCHLGGGLFSFQTTITKYVLCQVAFEAGVGKWHSIRSYREKIGTAVRDVHGNPVCINADFSRVEEHNLANTAAARSYILSGNPKLVAKSIFGNLFAYEFEQPILPHNAGQLRAQGLDDARHLVVSIGTPTVTPHRFCNLLDLVRATNPAAANLVTQRSVRTKFRGIGFVRGSLCLQRRADEAFALHWARSDGELRLTPQMDPQKIEFQSFSMLDSAQAVRGRPWDYKLVQLPSGKAWLDRKGMLHLRSEPDGSELTLVLDQRQLSGWFSETNQVFGTEFFCDADIPVPEAVGLWLEDFAKRCTRSLSS